jgi:HEAT repeat protein
MMAFCPDCWSGIENNPATCRKCGARIDIYSHEFEQRLVSLLPHSHAERRAEICLVLGQREKRSAVPHLVEVLADPEPLVRVAALRALSQIGDRSAVPAIQKVAERDNSAIRSFAKQVLSTLGAHPSKQRPVTRA